MASKITYLQQLNQEAIFSSSPPCSRGRQPLLAPHRRPRCCSRWRPARRAACCISPWWRPLCAAGGRGGGWWQRGSRCGLRSFHSPWESVRRSSILYFHTLTRWNKWPPCQPGRSLARREEGRAGRQFWDEQLRMGEERGKYDWFGFHTWILAPSIASATVDSGAARSTKKVELAWGAGGGLDIGNKISEIEMTKITRSRWWRMGTLIPMGRLGG